jgi:hypothetical protein
MRITKNFTKASFQKLFLSLILLLLLSSVSYGQADRGLYFLPILPNVRTVNPAVVPQYKVYVGIPFLSSVQTGIQNTFNYEDIFQTRGDSLYFDRDYFLGNLKDDNFGNMNLTEEVFSFGVKAKKNYFHFRIADMANANLNIRKELLKFFLYGNGSEEYLGKTVDLSGNLLNLTYYREYSLGYSRQIAGKWNVGLNLKYLQGIANFYSEKIDFKFYTDPQDFTISAQSDIRIHTAVPDLDGGSFEAKHFIGNTGNPGFAFDFGTQYLPNEKWDFGVSVLNIGSINWKSNLKSWVTSDPDKVVSFEGFDLNDFFDDNILDQGKIEDILDSISDELGIEETEINYKTKIPTIFDLNANYTLRMKNRFSGLVSTQFVSNNIWPSISLAYTRKFSDNFNMMLSYTALPDSYFNIGAGLAANLGPLQFYIALQNVLATFSVTSSNIFYLRFGFNLVFDGNRKKKVPEEEITE